MAFTSPGARLAVTAVRSAARKRYDAGARIGTRPAGSCPTGRERPGRRDGEARVRFGTVAGR